jgi:hypothetical protein
MTQHAGSIDFSVVRQQVPLTWFFEALLGAKPKPFAGGIRYSICPACGESKHATSTRVSVQDEHWKCFSCTEHGDVIDAAAAYWKIDSRAAALQLAGADSEVIQHHVATRPVCVAAPRDDQALRHVLSVLLEKAGTPDPDVLQYLASRGIPESLSIEACKRGLMVTLPADPFRAKEYLLDTIGFDTLVKAGLQNPEKRMPMAAYRPLILVSFDHSACEFRLITPLRHEGDLKSIRKGTIRPWAWKGTGKGVLITEGGIDLLSAVAMGMDHDIIGLPGCQNWRPEWFSKLAGRDVWDALDNDEPGHVASEKLKPVLIAQGAKYHRYRHQDGVKDLNDELMLRRR